MPEWKLEIRKHLAGLDLRPEREAEIVEELSDHLQQSYEELRARGAADDEALREVMAEVDWRNFVPELQISQKAPSPETVPEGAASSGHLLEDLWKDLRFALRMLRKSPGFAAVAVLTLALGIGANTAVFTVVDSLILNPLPVENISTLAAVNSSEAKKAARSGDLEALSYLNLKDTRERTRAFRNLAGHSYPMAVTMTDKGEPRRIFAEIVTANYFETLGIHPSLGRFFLPGEDQTPGAAPVAVLGYTAWQSRFGGVSDILGQTITLDETPFTVIGVGPKGFKGVYAVFGPDLWIPSMMAEQVLPAEQRNALGDRGLPLFTGIGRLRPGVTLREAQAEMNIVGAALAKEDPDANDGKTLTVTPLIEAAYGPERQPVVLGGILLMAIVGFVLLIACSNLANLLLARASVRRQEIAVRLSLGAGRMRLIRQLLTESVLLGLFSGVLGFLFGYGGCRILESLRPAEYAQNLADLRLDESVFVFALAVALLTGLIFGIVPALRSSRVSVAEVLKEETRGAGRSRGRVGLANTLLAGQVAASLVLLVVAALFLRSIEREYLIDPGFQTKHLALVMLYPGQAGYDRVRTEQFYKQTLERIGRIPGISSVSWASNLPLWGRKETGIVVEGQEARKKSEAVQAVVDTVDLNYFSTLGIPVLEGRDFTQNDRDSRTPVAIINETMAAKYWPAQDVLGKRLELPHGNQFLQIVGVVKTTNYQALGEPPQPCVYIPLRQNFTDSMILYARSERDPSTVLAAVQAEIHSLDPGLPVEDMRTGTKVIDQALWWSKIGVGLLGVFGLLALGLASVGLYGIMAYSVNQRRREIGVRMALGAGERSVTLLVLRQGMTVVASGVVTGMVLALLLGRVLSRFLYGVSGSDPLSLAGAAFALLAVAFVACYLPARSASRLDPLVALREA
ncbi:MAG TPA: ABC transporter permease [Candidatus Acidoferrum sp.]|nr:ABC transporter permease [Candidatus Acidoferrum sp.]